jgi:hypothetical protein
MTSKIKIETIFQCSLERAFKTPMLCDVSKVHTGFAGIMPKVISSTDDAMWGKPGHSKKIVAAKSLTQRGGWAFTDKVLVRIDNKYWKIELNDFQFPMFGLSKFVGEWKTKEIEPNRIHITYTYTLHSGNFLLYPLHWLFANTLWRIYMHQVIDNIREMAYNQEPYLYQ